MRPYTEYRTGTSQDREAALGAFIGTLAGSAVAAFSIYFVVVLVFSLA